MQIIQAVIGAAFSRSGVRGWGCSSALWARWRCRSGQHVFSAFVQRSTDSRADHRRHPRFRRSIFIQKVAVVLAGALGGGYAGYALAEYMGWLHQGFPWIPVVIGVILGINSCALSFSSGR